jgi:hypothetical protein
VTEYLRGIAVITFYLFVLVNVLTAAGMLMAYALYKDDI